MIAALDPLGLPLVSQVVPGNPADDVLYIPAIEQVLKIIDGIGLLIVGDSKMSALAIWAHIQQAGQHYLCPLIKTGNEWIIEHGFHRLKGAPLSLNPLFLKKDDQVAGLTNLLSLAVRMLTLVEVVVRQNLKQNQKKLTGLIENNPKKGIDNPTTERLLKTFRGIYLSTAHLPNQEPVRHITRLSNLQIRILVLLGLSPTIYSQLAEN